MAASEQKDKPKSIEFYGGYEVYSESGVDLTLLRENLRLSLEERWQKSQRALEFALALQQSGCSRKGITSPLDRPLNSLGAIDLVMLLAAHSIRYVLVGASAMGAQGLMGITEEIDICYQRTPANLEAVVAAFASIHASLRGAPPELSFRFDTPTLAAGVNFLLVTDCGYVNLLGEVSGVGNYDQVLAQSVEKTVYGLSIRILSVDGLIAAKKAAGRDKDHGHLLELLELKKMLDAAKPAEDDHGPASSA
jgi:hypothetical protein